MEQYWTPKEMNFENLRFCLDNHEASRLYIRDCGGYREDGSYRMKGLQKVNEDLKNKTLNFRKDSSGLHMLIDSDEVFHFPLENYNDRDKGFSVAYKRVEPAGENGHRRIINLSGGFNPYDRNLPEPEESFLRNIFDSHLIEIHFEGRIDLKFHSWIEEPHWKYWQICLSEDAEK